MQGRALFTLVLFGLLAVIHAKQDDTDEVAEVGKRSLRRTPYGLFGSHKGSIYGSRHFAHSRHHPVSRFNRRRPRTHVVPAYHPSRPRHLRHRRRPAHRGYPQRHHGYNLGQRGYPRRYPTYPTYADFVIQFGRQRGSPSRYRQFLRAMRRLRRDRRYIRRLIEGSRRRGSRSSQTHVSNNNQRWTNVNQQARSHNHHSHEQTSHSDERKVHGQDNKVVFVDADQRDQFYGGNHKNKHVSYSTASRSGLKSARPRRLVLFKKRQAALAKKRELAAAKKRELKRAAALDDSSLGDADEQDLAEYKYLQERQLADDGEQEISGDDYAKKREESRAAHHAKRQVHHAKRQVRHAKRGVAHHAKRQVRHAKGGVAHHAKRQVRHAKRGVAHHAKREVARPAKREVAHHAKRRIHHVKREFARPAKRQVYHAKRQARSAKRGADRYSGHNVDMDFNVRNKRSSYY